MNKMKQLKQLIPPLLPQLHKGQRGKLAVIGGSEDYTGAPYFAGYSAMLAGVDLVHIITVESAASVIKTYSPDLMVHPYRVERRNQIMDLISKMDVVIIGPGLGRERDAMAELMYLAIDQLVKNKTPLVLDADALYRLAVDKELQDLVLSNDTSHLVLTPNVIELRRLADAFNVETEAQLAAKLGCTLLAKSQTDKIFNTVLLEEPLECKEPGSLKRVGGQGDTLSGLVGAFLAWNSSVPEKIPLCCLAGSTAVRIAGHDAYEEHGRGMLASHLHKHIEDAIRNIEDAE